MKELVAKTGQYTNQQGEQKAEWTKIGVIMQRNDGSEYALIDPAVNLAGVLTKQNIMAAEEIRAGNQNAKIGKSVICSVFEKDRQQQGQPQHGGYQQTQQGYGQPAAQQPPAPSHGGVPGMNDDIPF